jgi:hypothetical protein
MNFTEKLKLLIEDTDKLINTETTSKSPDFVAWKMKSERLLLSMFGENSIEYKEFKKTSFSLDMYFIDTPKHQFIEKCHEGLNKSKALFNVYLCDLQDN